MNCTNRVDQRKDKIASLSEFVKSYNRFNSTHQDKADADSVGKIILTLKNTQESRDLLCRYILLTNADKKYINELFIKSRKKEDKKNEAHAYFLVGKRHAQNFQIDSTYYNYTKAEFLFKSIQDSVNLQEIYTHKAIVLLNNSIFIEGQEQILKAMSINKHHKDARIEYSESVIMANSLVGLDQLPEALDELDRALTLLTNPEISKFFLPDAIRLNKITIYYNIAEVYIKQGEYKQAKDLIHGVIDNYVNEGTVIDDMMLAHLLYNLAKVDIKSNNYKDVETNLTKAINIQLKNKNLQDYQTYRVLLGEFYYLTQRDSEAIGLLDDVILYAKEQSSLTLEREALSILLKFRKENYQNNFIRYEKINKHILNDNNIIKNTFARLSFEADNLQRANQNLQNQKELLTKVGGIVFFVAIIIFFILLFRQKSKEVSLVKLLQIDTEKYYNSIMNVQNELAEARHLERKEIAKELHEGVLNRLFVTRFLLMQVNKDSVEDHKSSLINEVKQVEHYIRGVSHALANDEEFKINEFDQLLGDLIAIQNRCESTEFNLHIEKGICFVRLSNKYKVHIYRIVQECLQNVHKHAEATQCNVLFVIKSKTSFEVIIKDNGIGFNTDIVRKGIGFANIKDRILFMKSKLHIVSSGLTGTKVFFLIQTKDIKEN
ncbi:two-component sensor histidine kinase [Myroides sp. M-43]|uniref:ATP-binding protein n=1 Tax=Myroides oncorhynchi TaxID=2893756 RepID=UPI001E52ABC5|nr:tetratricopeptide repeat-containing sensor histidine kinase [Myroides oncorhynchi]MCC9043522.1 two-component sensor histidine kinase [Myroides oncorhynchi]